MEKYFLLYTYFLNQEPVKKDGKKVRKMAHYEV